jgi:hypothetical protein
MILVSPWHNKKNLRDEHLYNQDFSHHGIPRFCKSRIAGSTRDSRLMRNGNLPVDARQALRSRIMDLALTEHQSPSLCTPLTLIGVRVESRRLVWV